MFDYKHLCMSMQKQIYYTNIQDLKNIRFMCIA